MKFSVFLYRPDSAEKDQPVQIAIELYEKGRQLSMLSTDDYREHIRDMPQYYHITPKDLTNMNPDMQASELVNGHLSKTSVESMSLESVESMSL